MTWLSTWPDAGCIPQYREHASEAAAEAHAAEVIKSRRALVATVFWSSAETEESAA